MTTNALAENLKVRIGTFGAMIAMLCAIMYGVYDTRARIITGEKERAELKLADKAILAKIELKRSISEREWQRDQADRYLGDFAQINDLIETDIWNIKYDKKGE